MITTKCIVNWRLFKGLAKSVNLSVSASASCLRTFSYTVPLSARDIVSQNENREFMAVFPDIVRDLTSELSSIHSKDASKWYAEVLQFNVPHGKKNRGLTTIITCRQLLDKLELSSENVRLAHYLGWCVEMLQTSIIMIDDVMDCGVTRRGRSCWYRLEYVGMVAVNDALMIENGIYYILKKYFSDKHYYLKLIELFREAMFITCIGQTLDTQMSRKDVTHFSMEKYKSITSHKTSFYTFYFPVAIAMHMCGLTDPDAFRQARTILLEIGFFYQIQNDFLDCFGDPALTGKVGNDIQENKCSWLAIVCMQRASEEQKKIMKECYGQKDSDKVARVKELYEELNIPNTYAAYEEESYNTIKTQIQQECRGVPQNIFFNILDKIYQKESCL